MFFFCLIMKWIVLMYLSNIPFLIRGECDCGRGGLCRVYSSDPKMAISAEPCRCEEVSRGIFVNARQHCDTMIKYCGDEVGPCDHGSKCFNAFGNYVCNCTEGWTGKDCSYSEGFYAAWYATFVHLWYPLTGAKTWSPIFSGRVLTSKSEITFRYEDEVSEIPTGISHRKWITDFSACSLLTSKQLRSKCKQTGNGPDCNIMNNLTVLSRYHYKCDVILPFAPSRNVYVEGVHGPMGQYHDVHVTVQDGKIIQHSNTYRVFLDMIQFLKLCPIRLKFYGCAETQDYAPFYELDVPFTLSVGTFLSGILSEGCIVKYRTYKWMISPLVRYKSLQYVGSDATVTVRPDNIHLKPGMYYATVNITFGEFIESASDESVVGLCYFGLKKPRLSVFVQGLDREYECESDVVVILNATVPLYPFLKNDLRYDWNCSGCEGAELYDDRLRLFLANQSCGSTLEITLTVYYARWEVEARHNGTLYFIRFPYNIDVSCSPGCSSYNPTLPLTITASESPDSNSYFTWSSIKHIPFFKCKYPRNQIVIIEANTFDKSFIIKVTTPLGSKIVNITLAPEPPGLHCEIVPPSGMSFQDKFNISCKQTDPMPFMYSVYQSYRKSLVSSSSNGNILNVDLVFPPILVESTTHLGRTSSLYLNVNLKANISPNLIQLIHSRIESIELLLLENAYSDVASQVDLITGMSVLIEWAWNQRLMGYLSRIPVCYWEDCIIHVANSIRRLMEPERINNSSDNVHLHILRAASTLLAMTRSFDYIESKVPQYSPVLFQIIQALYKATRRTLSFIDPLILYPNADVAVRHVHLRLVKRGNQLGREVLRHLGLFVTRIRPHPTTPVELVSGNDFKILRFTVFSNEPMCINMTASEFINRSNFQILPEAYARWKQIGEPPVSVSVVNFRTTSFWWIIHQPKFTFGEELELHMYVKTKQQWKASKDALGPIRTLIRLDTVDQLPYTPSLVTGIGRRPYDTTALTSKERNHLVDVYIYHVPPGYGVLFLTFDPIPADHPIRLVFRESEWPDYETVQSAPTLNTNPIEFSYFQRSTSEYIYVGILQHIGITYTFHVTLIQCMSRSEDRWKSDDCTYFSQVNDVIQCTCSQISRLFANAKLSAPKETYVISQEIPLIAGLKYNFYAKLFMALFLLFFLLLLCFAWLGDLHDKKRRPAVFAADNYPGDANPYLISIYSGGTFLFRTTSNVAFRLVGSHFSSRVHVIKSPESGCWLLIFTPRKLGALLRIELWHDSTGLFPSWYCQEVVVHDLKAKFRFRFKVEAWLTAKELSSRGNCTYVVQRLTHRDNETEQKAFSSYFGEYVQAYTVHYHRWVSIFIHHPRSFYTRLDRTLILFVVVFVMIATSMTFYVKNFGPADEPKVTFTEDDFNIAFITILISLPFIIFMGKIFRRSKDKFMARLGVKPERRCCAEPIVYIPILTEKKYKEQTENVTFPAMVVVSISAFLICLSIAITLMIGWQFGLNKSRIWVISFVIAMLGEMLILNPAMIILAACGAACAHPSPPYDGNVLLTSQDCITGDVIYKDFEERLKTVFETRTTAAYSPPSLTWLKIAERISKARTALFRTAHLTLVTLLVILCYILITTMDTESAFFRNRQLFNQLTQGVLLSGIDLKSVLNRTRYYDYLNIALLPSLHRITWYNGHPLNPEGGENDSNQTFSQYRGYGANYVTKMLGPPRLRQKRVSFNESIPVASFFRRLFPVAFGHLNSTNEDKNSYLPGWMLPQSKKEYQKTYRWFSDSETRTPYILGPSDIWYSGSGYVEDLHWSSSLSHKYLVDLELDGWIDNLTRVVFITFNMYNTNLDEILCLTIVTDCLSTGVFRSQAIIDSTFVDIRRSPYATIFAIVVIAITIIMVILVFRTVFAVVNDGLINYLTSFIGIIDLVLIWFGLGVIVFYGEQFFHFFFAFDEAEGAVKETYTPLYKQFSNENSGLVYTGIFCTSVTVMCAVRFRSQEFKRGTNLSSSYIFILNSMMAVVTISAAVNFYTFGGPTMGAPKVLSLYHMLYLKEPTWSRYGGYSVFISPAIFLFLLIASLHVAIFTYFYSKAANLFGAQFKTRRLTVAQLQRWRGSPKEESPLNKPPPEPSHSPKSNEDHTVINTFSNQVDNGWPTPVVDVHRFDSDSPV